MGSPEYYLGGDVDMMNSSPSTKDIDGVMEVDHDEKDKHLNVQWLRHNVKTAFSARTYIKNTIERLERMMDTTFKLERSPMAENLHPEIDDSPFLDATGHHRFRSMIGCANWLITLGRFDIAYAVNSLSRHNMAPRQGHLKAVMRIFGYLKKFWKARIIVDPNYPNHSMFPTPECDNWKEFYPDAQEHIPDKADTPLPKVW